MIFKDVSKPTGPEAFKFAAIVSFIVFLIILIALSINLNE